MTIVVDASFALKWVVEKPGSDAVEELLEKDLATPSLWLIDAANALWRRTARRELTAAETAERLTELTKAAVASVPVKEDLPEPMRLAVRLNHRRCPVRAGGGQPWDACRAHSGLVADGPRHLSPGVVIYERARA